MQYKSRISQVPNQVSYSADPCELAWLSSPDFLIFSGIPEAETFGRNRKFSAFGFRFQPPKLEAEYGHNSRKALDFLLFVHENIANVNYQW